MELENIKGDSLIKGKLVIEISRSFPGEVDSSGIPKYDGSIAGEHIFIFGDGEVFSKRDCYEKWLDQYFPEGFHLDETWKTYNEPNIIYSRECKYSINENQIKELLNQLGKKEGELLPGETVAGFCIYGMIRIILKVGKVI
jgi:hypothetical protein